MLLLILVRYSRCYYWRFK